MDKPNLKILLVEDNDVDASVVESLLGKAASTRFDVVRVERVAQAEQLLAKFRVDAVLLDLNLPDSQGMETFRAVTAALQDEPVLIMTSLEDEELALSAVQEGAQDYLYKSTQTGDSLVRAIRYAIGRKQIQQELSETVAALQAALADVKALTGLLPICSSCKKVRDDGGYWRQVETFLTEHTDAEFSHGVCPDCFREMYPEHYYKQQAAREGVQETAIPGTHASTPSPGDSSDEE